MIPAPFFPQAVAQAIVAERELRPAFSLVTLTLSFKENPHDGRQGAQERFSSLRYHPYR
jgi:hypothetical protein